MNIYVWQILQLAMTILTHVTFIILLPLWCLLASISFFFKKKKKITQTHQHISTQNFPGVQALNEGDLSHSQVSKRMCNLYSSFTPEKLTLS